MISRLAPNLTTLVQHLVLLEFSLQCKLFNSLDHTSDVLWIIKLYDRRHDSYTYYYLIIFPECYKLETLSNFLNHRIGDSLRRLLKDNLRKTCRFVCLIVCWLGLPSKYTTHLGNGVVLPWRGEVSNITNNSFLKSSMKNKRLASTILKPCPDFWLDLYKW